MKQSMTGIKVKHEFHQFFVVRPLWGI